MIKTIRNPFAASAAHQTENEIPENRCSHVEGNGTG